MNRRFSLAPLFLTILTSLTLATAASAQVIYSDSFNRNGVLQGSTPDVDTTGATWTADSANILTATTGGGQAYSNGQGLIASLPVTIAPGHVYTYTSTVNISSGQFVNIALDAAGVNPDIPYANPTISELLFPNVNPQSVVQAFINGTSTEFDNQSPVGNLAGNPNVLSLVLDTTQAAYSVTAFLNGTADGTYTYTSTTNPNITSLGLSFLNYQGVANATFANLQFVETTPGTLIPEPKTNALLLGGLGFLLTVWKVRARRALNS